MITKILTDPLKHDGKNFAYIVHSLMENEAAIDTTTITKRISKILDCNRFYSASLIAKFSPKNAAKMLGIYEPIERLRMFSGAGLIIKPCEEDIYVASEYDLLSPEKEKLNEYAERFKGCVKSPLELLTADCLDHNEIIIRGGEKTSVEAVCYLDNLQAVDLAKLIQSTAERYLSKPLPLIEIPSI